MEEKLKALESAIANRINGFEIVYKNKSVMQKFLGKILFFCPGYYDRFISTFYPKVYWPSEEKYRESVTSSFYTLAHEYVHLCDGKENRFWFGFSYLMPHWFVFLAFLSLLSIWFSNWWLMSLVSLIFVLPWPAYWRTKWEVRGYAMDMAIDLWRGGVVSEIEKEILVKHFTGWSYYKMWPFRKGITKKLEAMEQAIHSGDILLMSPAYKDVKAIIDLD